MVIRTLTLLAVLSSCYAGPSYYIRGIPVNTAEGWPEKACLEKALAWLDSNFECVPPRGTYFLGGIAGMDLDPECKNGFFCESSETGCCAGEFSGWGVISIAKRESLWDSALVHELTHYYHLRVWGVHWDHNDRLQRCVQATNRKLLEIYPEC